MQTAIHYLRKIHTFLQRESFYPLLLATMLACALLVFRLYTTRSWLYFFLSWNLFLAWIPYLCSLVIRGANDFFSRGAWLTLPLVGLWLLFFPNAPYIVTDLIHLTRRSDFPLWYDVGLIATFAWVGCFLAVASLHSMQNVVREVAGWLISWLFVLSSILLSGLGIYLGRFLRWNSWDILYNPRSILSDAINPLLNPTQNPQAIGVTLMFSAFLFICYLTFIAARGTQPPTQGQSKPNAIKSEQATFKTSNSPVVFAPTVPLLEAVSDQTYHSKTEHSSKTSSDTEWVFDWG